MAELEEWTCEYDGLILNSPDSAIFIKEIEGLLSLPDIRSSDLELVQRDGLWPGDDFLGGREITLSLRVQSRYDDQFARVVNALQTAFAAGREELPFRFRLPGLCRGETAFVMCRPRKRDVTMTEAFARYATDVTVSLFATDPRLYSQEMRRTRVTTTAAPPLGPTEGLAVPMAAPLLFQERQGPLQKPKFQRIEVRGSEPVRPLVHFEDAVNPRLTHVTSGAHFEARSNGELLADFDTGTLSDPRGRPLPNALAAPSSTWLRFAPGANWVALTHGDEFTQARATISWRDVWV
ncbi:hypothetical protein [Streptomyces cacaoi]|uniref:Phage tail protein n=1 Tax=Streptomyces cacaoi TaxID=1898 RepID=A0A4Y3R359_STRCI|nr:hypothetical protein [Streptomyces cacaoi]GEB50450.1 hypothetical protein SCA03_30010 [Streptomyces cacaoi]